MKAAIINPYLDTLGGGERYTFSFVKVLRDLGYSVDVEWGDASIKEKVSDRFGIDISGINFVSDTKRGSGYDLCFWVSDGSIPALLARRNIIHFQVPFKGVNGKSLINKMKLFRIGEVVVNSAFTKSVIDSEYGVDSKVIYPPVDILKLKPRRKENTILYVGRFSELKQAKKQDVLIKAFKRLYDSGTRDWKLVLAGGVEVGSGSMIEKLSKLSEGYPIKIIKSPSYKELLNLYGSAKIFWSASGYGTDEGKHPELTEHFGITVVEAMASGCAPLIYDAGGHSEIVSSGTNGYLWKSTSDLIRLTKRLIKERMLMNKISKEAVSSSQKFGYERFEKEVTSVL